jgi:hypothetical protein
MLVVARISSASLMRLSGAACQSSMGESRQARRAIATAAKVEHPRPVAGIEIQASGRLPRQRFKLCAAAVRLERAKGISGHGTSDVADAGAGNGQEVAAPGGVTTRAAEWLLGRRQTAERPTSWEASRALRALVRQAFTS